ncbi:menaquinol oxidoreductase complex Cbc6, cytochrome c subunit, putative, 4 heme-binding sites [Geotalea daltonii FRC-32]|uniref:Menaquinol oxidoreductase complex Cbc6, cytochrome c subunit, putative, 4 heme-binding sites n=1 Tax=Geotalea daltonii (strain DSM 22248 / JCM 15807 / FRC-32) TaxID=316067 RepID=B9M4I2_GEODF|nr:selenite/tellurite reduction operon c-type cytochrome lipoprotein ExtS [Geotalea daltonii]ACM19708.1 menaquinol oxidoreductase complex Cbc6, cytochrome c subunit, putative, 4 heme-binding sites [Geotalea daltonii FRC-32]
MLLFPAMVSAGRKSACLTCHPSHHTGRGSCTGCHRGNDRSERKNIAHHGLIGGRYAHFTIPGSKVVEEGKKLIGAGGCRRCHTTGDRGNRLAADLDKLFPGASPEDVFKAIKNPVLYMPDFHFVDTEIVSLVNAIASGARQETDRQREIVQVVHFIDDGLARENSFVRLCGSCHKLLSHRYGGLGSGHMGPSLSGLFSEFYPATFAGKTRWREDNLKRWLKNPRKVRPNALMPPVAVTAAELEQLTDAMVVPYQEKNSR